MNDKYLIFSPYRSGLSNVLMSYECALAVAHITGRKIVMLPGQYLVFIADQENKEQWHSPWDFFDEQVFKKEFDVVEFKDLDIPTDVKQRVQSNSNWIEHFTEHVSDCWEYKYEGTYHMTPPEHCMVNNAGQYYGLKDFENFLSNRKIIELFKNNKYIVFNNNFFHHYWYLVYPGVAAERNKIKDKINKVVKYKQHFYNLFNETPISKIGSYNALHIRRNDFFIQFGRSLESVNTGEKLLSQLNKLVDDGRVLGTLPFFISSDEKDLSYFDPLKEKYRLIFSSNFNGHLNKLEQAVLDQIICSKATRFVGTFNSTYSKRIEIMRGLDGKPTNDHMGINSIDQPPSKGSFPWLDRYDKKWHWNQSSYLQWTKEDVS